MMNESPIVTRSTIPLAITSLRFQSNSWYLTDELPQFNARISTEKVPPPNFLVILMPSAEGAEKMFYFRPIRDSQVAAGAVEVPEAYCGKPEKMF
ncbi:hypothetical protein [Desulfuromonas sp. DDH964]|uniref:hypothetical protein n=1 Tax=Desulfuromonas sp. DDH964 TaxID=1823759 RepID=UPI001E6331CB|nr:hypothetical protein [Desulfuromonas sp. DDH964]